MGLDIAAERERAEKEKQQAEIKAAKAKARKEALNKTIDKTSDAAIKTLIGKFICSQCGYTGRPKKYTKGSFILELFLWLAGIAITVLSVFNLFLVLIIPLVFSIWRLVSKYKACPQCKGNMIKTDSPMGQKLVKELNL